jgi:hypothetical protein
MLMGPAATEASKGRVFEDAFRNSIVVRGGDPLPVREPVPLKLPKEAAAQLDGFPGDAADDSEGT